MAKPLAAAAALMAFLAVPAQAQQGRPDSRTMTCGEVHALLDARGAAVLSTGRHTYDRYVASGRFCIHPDIAVRATIATRDTGRCVVHRCAFVDREDRIWRFRR